MHRNAQGAVKVVGREGVWYRTLPASTPGRFHRPGQVPVPMHRPRYRQPLRPWGSTMHASPRTLVSVNHLQNTALEGLSCVRCMM